MYLYNNDLGKNCSNKSNSNNNCLLELRAVNQIRKAVLTVTLGIDVSSNGISFSMKGGGLFSIELHPDLNMHSWSYSKLSVLMWLSLLDPREISVICRK